MSPNEAVAKVKELIAADPALGAKVTAAWNRVCDDIEARALKQRPKPKVFEVHHQTQVAREALLQAVAAGRPINTAENEALQRVGLA